MDNFYPRSPCGERPYSQHVRRPSGYFYPRSPCGERPHRSRAASMMALFLSTLSLRRATDCAGCALKKYLISIHALLAESDDSGPRKIKVDFLFLSTLSLRRATAQVCQVVSAELYFYPRSPCGERLHHHLIPNSGTLHFYPRSPCGERLHCKTPITFRHYFYPRSPCGERLYDTYAKVLRVNISIHALLAESDIITRARNSTIRISIHALLAESDTPEG